MKQDHDTDLRALENGDIAHVDRIKTKLRYDPDTGDFTWLNGAGGRFSGMIAGHVTMYGYRSIEVLGRRYFAHRLAFLMMTGNEASDQIDHINGNRLDNRWANLRVCSHLQNMQNLRSAKKSNKSSGLLGVSFRKQTSRWQAQIRIDGRIKHLGYFADKQDAHQAYLAAKRIHHSSCTI